MPPAEPLTALHRRIHESAAEAVRAGRPAVDPVPVDGDARWGLSLVALPDADTRAALQAAAAGLASTTANPHVAYDAGDLHMTVRSLEGFADEVPEAVIDRYCERLTSALRGVGPLTVRFEGMFLTSTGVVACGHPDPVLPLARERLAADAAAHGWNQVRGGDAARIRDTAHVSLMVFRDAAARDDRLVDHVEASHGTALGTMTVDRLALVTYTVSGDGVKLHRRGWVPL
ncbi:2'-5' RNA ligase family protein [Agromyces rhizosphaerae]|nr:hypothetical protein [Agromyces rhizosphaerae]